MLNETRHHGDVLLGDYEDSYRNLSYKVLTGLHWALRQCSVR